MANFISNRNLHKDKKILQLNGFGQAAWHFISSIYKTKWDMLKTDDNNRTFRQNIVSKFTFKTNAKNQ